MTPDRIIFETPEEVLASATDIVEGVLTADVRELERRYEDSQLGPDIVIKHAFSVERSLKGRLRPGDTAWLGRLYTGHDPVPVVEWDARPLETGHRYLLLLGESTIYDGVYGIAMGAQGQFEIIDGSLDPVSRCPITAEAFDQMTVDDVARLVDQAP